MQKTKFMKYIYLITLLLVSISCQPKSKTAKLALKEPTPEKVMLTDQQLQDYETAYFASGCFWCVEAIFESVKGVKEVVSGYSGGTEKNPTYEEVAYGRTRHAEAVEVYYDPKVISFQKLVQVFFGSHDPTSLNRQGPDKGAQYRSIAFYKNEDEKKIIEDKIAILNEELAPEKVAAEVMKFEKFWVGEDYHQDYEKLHPNQGYIQAVSVPRLKRFQAKFPDLIKKDAH
jgi:peptide-methionine (S)-S-oxide reductase